MASTYIRPTAESVLNSGVHGRIRREERNIQKIDLQRARRYGMKEPARFGRVKYTYGGIVFIYDPHNNREVTSYPSADAAPQTSGTKNAEPVILKKKEGYDLPPAPLIRDVTRDKLLQNKDKWTSHSVLVVDMSGSMRRDDVNGARCRSDGVFLSIARDYVKKPLENKSRSNTDLVSVILMKDTAEIVLRYEMTDWVLFNKLIDLRDWTNRRPSGAGNYMPALETAERLLMTNQASNCSLSLMFFSDGKPSDRGNFSEKMGQLSSKFGRRLSVACIGMAEKGEDFSTLNDMVKEATAYGAVAYFNKPTLDADSLSNIITELASSLTTSITELTNVNGHGSGFRKVRNIVRERKNTPDDVVLNDDWTCYANESTNVFSVNNRYLNNIWSWNTKLNDFVRVIDTRCVECWKHIDSSYNNNPCPFCKACYFCDSCYTMANINYHRNYGDCADNISKMVSGGLVKKDVPSFSIAMKKQIFGEGAERIVRKCRFLDNDKCFKGPIMVAKESRFLDESNTENAYSQRMDYHREFMRTQSIASDMAIKFNDALASLWVHFPRNVRSLVMNKVRTVPKIHFLEPMVVETISEQGEYNVLVEPMLEGTYEKFNDNMGMVQGQNKAIASIDELTGAMGNLNLGIGGNLDLGIIEEGSEEEDDDEDSIIEETINGPNHGSYSFDEIQDAHIPQTFSHFSYEQSKNYLMVVDLQGVLKVNDDGTKCYELTDPVIHKRRKIKKKKFEKYTFGRTDRGEKGMKNFFETHKCNELCRLLGLPPRNY